MENENINENVIINKDSKKTFNFEAVWEVYPNKIGKKEAIGYFNITVKTDEDFRNIKKAVENYLKYIRENQTERKYIKSGCNWFDDWESWVNYKNPEIQSQISRGLEEYTHPKETSKEEREKVSKLISETAKKL